MSVDKVPPAFDGLLIPHLVCNNATAAIDFYSKAFGATEMFRMPAPDGQRLMHAALMLGKAPVYVVDDFPEFCGGHEQSPTALKGTPVTIHRYVPDCDAAVSKAQSAGATVVMPPADMFWGDRYAIVQDPFGHKWSLATHIKDMTPAEMAQGMNEAFAQGPPG